MTTEQTHRRLAKEAVAAMSEEGLTLNGYEQQIAMDKIVLALDKVATMYFIKQLRMEGHAV